jgi:DNA repair protein RecN (Recombination protein N)
MLKELNIKNFAIIDQLRVEFTPGLNVFTGETGAGKSIVVDALNLALGERANADLIRTGCQEAVVEADFALDGRSMKDVSTLLASQGIELQANEDMIVRRVLSASGKNKIYINGSLANLAALAALGAVLADIHGQHEHQSLLSNERQMDLLDSFGALESVREEVADDYERLMGVRKELAGLETDDRERAQREDILRFQKNEIDTAKLLPGEDTELANIQKVLANAERLAALCSMVDEMLYSSDHSVVTMMKKSIDGLKDIIEIDNKLTGTVDLCKSAHAQIEEAAHELSSYSSRIEFDPERLEQVGDRLDLIYKLKKKYGHTIEEILEFGDMADAELERMERSVEDIERLKSEIQAIKFGLTDKANELTRKRGAAAKDLERKVEAELAYLGMKRTTFTVQITQEPGGDTLDGHKIGHRGADRVEFLISPNPGEEPKPLAKTASGGELSRIMLALKSILVEGDQIPTVVFDEVDVGIGGAVAEVVGKRLKSISSKRQVFCITHLPQIAMMADSHYGVSKSVKKDRTSTEVRLLEHKERVDEIARMLGGKTITEATIRHAQEMMERGSA